MKGMNPENKKSLFRVAEATFTLIDLQAWPWLTWKSEILRWDVSCDKQNWAHPNLTMTLSQNSDLRSECWVKPQRVRRYRWCFRQYPVSAAPRNNALWTNRNCKFDCVILSHTQLTVEDGVIAIVGKLRWWCSGANDEKYDDVWWREHFCFETIIKPDEKEWVFHRFYSCAVSPSMSSLSGFGYRGVETGFSGYLVSAGVV